jgi:hypothetical protein
LFSLLATATINKVVIQVVFVVYVMYVLVGGVLGFVSLLFNETMQNFNEPIQLYIEGHCCVVFEIQPILPGTIVSVTRIEGGTRDSRCSFNKRSREAHKPPPGPGTTSKVGMSFKLSICNAHIFSSGTSWNIQGGSFRFLTSHNTSTFSNG